MLKMMQHTGNKLEPKMDNFLQQTLSKEIQDLKPKQAEMQTITEIKNCIRSNQQQNTGGRRTNKQGGGQISGNYGCRTEKRKKIENK